jgi:hypothetical protein
MADKESPPWLLGVFWFALLVLAFGTLARSGTAGYLRASVVEAAPDQMAVAWQGHRSAAPPDARTKRTKLNTPYGQGSKGAKDPLKQTLEGLDDDRDQFDAPAGRTLQPHRIDPGRKARRFNNTILPYLTEGALLLVVGICLGFLTKLELVVVTSVSVAFALALAYLEWREYVSLPFAALWDWSWVAVLNPMEGKETLAAVGGKLASVGLGTIGFIVGMKG